MSVCGINKVAGVIVARLKTMPLLLLFRRAGKCKKIFVCGLHFLSASLSPVQGCGVFVDEYLYPVME